MKTSIKLQNDRQVPLDTIKRIIGYYKYIFLQKRYQSVDELFDILPMILKVDFQYSKNRMVFDKVSVCVCVSVCRLRLLANVSSELVDRLELFKKHFKLGRRTCLTVLQGRLNIE